MDKRTIPMICPGDVLIPIDEYRQLVERSAFLDTVITAYKRGDDVLLHEAVVTVVKCMTFDESGSDKLYEPKDGDVDA